MISANTNEPRVGFRHEALWYGGEQGFIDSVGGLLEGALVHDEPALVVVDDHKIERLRSHLGRRAARVSFADMREVGRNPARIIPAWRAFVDSHDGRPLMGIGEPVWPGRSDDELEECFQHEMLLNLAFADSPNFRLTCPYDVAALEPDTMAKAEGSHPVVSESGLARSSDSFPRTGSSSELLAGQYAEPPAAAMDRRFDGSDLSELRRWIEASAVSLGLSRVDADDLVLSAGEIATNSVRHGGGAGRSRLWATDHSVICEIADDGRIRDPLAGRREPLPTQGTGYGLWIANQLCDLVQIRSLSGTVVRLHVELDRQRRKRATRLSRV